MFLSSNILFRDMKFQQRKQLCSRKAHFIHLHNLVHDFLKKKKKKKQAQVSSPWCMHTPQKCQRGIQFFFSALKLLLCGLVVLTDMSTYLQRRREFQNILERKLYNSFGQLFLIYQKKLNMKLNIILIAPAETLDICEIYSRFDKYLAV